MKVKDIMITDIQACGPDTNLADAAKMMWDMDCGVLPVVNGQGKVVGMITDRDICIAVATKHRLASEIVVWEIISGKVFSCKPAEDVRDALKTMATGRVRRLPVLNEEGILEGMLTMNDMALYAREAYRADVTYEDLMAAFKAICAHRVALAV